MTKKPPRKSAAPAKAGATKRTTPKNELAISLSLDAERMLEEMASDAGCSVDELAAELLIKQISRRARQKEKIQTEPAPLEAFLDVPAARQGGIAEEIFLEETGSAEHLSFKKIAERQRKLSKPLGTLFDDLPEG